MVNTSYYIRVIFVSENLNLENKMMKGYLFLIIAIILETIGTSLLKVSDQFTKLFPSLGAIIAYIGCFYILSLSLKTIPIGIAYGIWVGAGIVLVMLVGFCFFKQTPDFAAILGTILIISGIVVINVFSKMGIH